MSGTLGVLLAGGMSRRYGSDKAFALWDGEPYLAHVARALAPHCDPLVVCGRADVQAEAYARLAPGARVLPDEKLDEGPVVALRRALAAFPARWVVVAGCDSPALAPQHVADLLAAARTREGPARLVHEGRALHAVFAAPAGLVAERAARSDRMMPLTEGAVELEVAGPGWNVNRPEDAKTPCPRHQ